MHAGELDKAEGNSPRQSDDDGSDGGADDDDEVAQQLRLKLG